VAVKSINKTHSSAIQKICTPCGLVSARIFALLVPLKRTKLFRHFLRRVTALRTGRASCDALRHLRGRPSTHAGRFTAGDVMQATWLWAERTASLNTLKQLR
jgi:hypothetical protein